MSLSKKWKKFWDNESFVYLRVWMKNFRNKEFFSKKNIFQVHINGEENRGAAVYKIWIDGGEAGFFALQRFVLDGLYVADVCGFKPYILITNTKYNRTSAVDDNMFDYYYDQPCYSSAVLNQSCCVIDFDLDHRRWLEDQFVTGDGMLSGYEFKPELIERLAQIKQKYLHLNKTASSRLEKDYLKILDDRKTLGIHFRGNAFSIGFKDHPVGLVPEDYFEYIDEALRNGFEKIFVATDDSRALNGFKERYEEHIVCYDDTTRSTDSIDVHDHRDSYGKDGQQIGYEVLRDMMTLSRCSGLICGKSQVSFAVLIEKGARDESFEYIKVIDKGVYSNDSKAVEKYMDSIEKYK